MAPTEAGATTTAGQASRRVRHGPSPEAWERWDRHLDRCEEPPAPPVVDPMVGGFISIPYTGPSPKGEG